MSNVARIPYTEIVERVQAELLRDTAQNDASEYKYKGAVNDVYLTDFTLMLPEDYLRKEAYISTKADYSTGTVTVAVADTAIVGVGTSWTSALTNDSLFKDDSGQAIYRVNYTSGTELALVSPTAWIDDAVAAGSYRVIFDRFALASDFSHMAMDDAEEPENVHWWSNGSRCFLYPRDNGEFEKNFQFQYGTPNEYSVKWVSGVPYLYIFPCDDEARSIHYTYIPSLIPLTEYTTGTISTLANGGTTVTGVGTDFDGYIQTGYDYYFRLDRDGTGANSKWYKVSAAGSSTSLTIAAYGGTAVSGGALNYTIAMASEWPARFDTAMIYGAALRIAPTAGEAARWSEMYQGLIPAHKSLDSRRVYGKRGAFKRR